MTTTASTITSDVTPNDVKPAAYLCYVHGLLVPIVSATVSYGVGMIPEATITFFPSKHLHRFGAEDRVEVVLFYLDTAGEKNEYCLLFEGEIVRWNYTTTATSQALSVRAVADIAILDKIVYGLMNTVDTVHTKFLNTDAAETVKAGVYMQAGLMRDGLLVKAQGDGDPPEPTISRPYDILQNVLMGLAGGKNQYGEAIPRSPWQGLAAINFFSRWARKRNFINRFVACPDFDEDAYGIAERTQRSRKASKGVFPLTRAFEKAAILNTIQTQVGTWFNTADTVKGVIDKIFQLMFYELQMLPTARCVTVKLKTGEIDVEGSLQNRTTAPNTRPIRLTNYYAKPRMYFADTPKFNVVYPSMMTSFSYTEDYAAQPTRVYVNEEMEQQLLNTENGSLVDKISRAILAVAYPPEAQEHLDQSIRKKTRILQPVTEAPETSVPYGTAKNILIYPEEFYRGPAVVRGRAPSVFNMYARKQAEDKNLEPDQAVRSELQQYAEYEYYTQRYNKRGGQVEMVFNPYVVPGYPTTIINRPGGMSVLGYVVSVSHTLSTRGMSTAMTYTGGRTALEALRLLKADRARMPNFQLTSAPADPIDEVMWVTQGGADSHYEDLFYGRTPNQTTTRQVTKKPASSGGMAFVEIDNAYYVGVRTWPLYNFRLITATDDAPFDLQIKKTSKKDAPKRRPQTKKDTPTVGTFALNDLNVDSVIDMQPKSDFTKFVDSTNEAMKDVRRPICTIHEYIAFRNGMVIETDKSVAQKVGEWLKARNKPRNPRNTTDTEANQTAENWAEAKDKGRQQYSSATYYDRIAWFDTSPVSSEDVKKVSLYYREGNVSGSTQPYIKYSSTVETISGAKHHSYRNWDDILRQYREEIWNDTPNEP